MRFQKIHHLTQAEAQDLIFRHGGNKSAAAREAGCSRRTLKRIAAGIRNGSPQPSGDKIVWDMKRGSGLVSVDKSSRITTPEQLLALAEIDLDEWEIDRQVVNKWEVGAKADAEGGLVVTPLYQIKVWLKRRKMNATIKALEEIVSRVEASQPLVLPVDYRATDSDGGHLLDISIVDHHFGKLAWSPETGEDYDLKIAEGLYVRAAESLLKKASGFDVDRILMPIGHDLLHINSFTPETAKGTPQDVDSRLIKIMDVALRSVIAGVEFCRQVAPVVVKFIPGNHDPLTSYSLCKTLEAYYRNTPDVEVDVGPKHRKYFKYGVSLIGMTHGDEEKHRDLPTIIMSECRDILPGVKHIEWQLGHLHKKRETSFASTDSYGPVIVRIIPSLCGTDAWHYRKGYVHGERAAEAYLYSRSQGYTGHFSCNVGEIQ